MDDFASCHLVESVITHETAELVTSDVRLSPEMIPSEIEMNGDSTGNPDISQEHDLDDEEPENVSFTPNFEDTSTSDALSAAKSLCLDERETRSEPMNGMSQESSSLGALTIKIRKDVKIESTQDNSFTNSVILEGDPIGITENKASKEIQSFHGLFDTETHSNSEAKVEEKIEASVTNFSDMTFMRAEDSTLQSYASKNDPSEDFDQNCLKENLEEDSMEGMDEDEGVDQEIEEDFADTAEDLIPDRKLRRRKETPDQDKARLKRETIRKISRLLKQAELSSEDSAFLEQHSQLASEAAKRLHKRKKLDERKLEVEDEPGVLAKKCLQLAKAIQKSKYLVVYTGAGISTAANIPDYRGPNGVWTLMEQGKTVGECKLDQSHPTFTHMALFSLFKRGKLKHIVSQNCDGLHMRSGMPRYSLSEIHGNMFIEICKHCKPMRPFVRFFDVTERTNKNRHTTFRRCYICGNSLYDTIVHFGERGWIKWPINWTGATRAAEKADVILCLGSSLKVLRRYTWLWCMDRPPKMRPKLFIVNLQWTPKDSSAKLKINGRCDEVLKQVMDHLGYSVPEYCRSNDPLLSFATRINERELHTSTRKDIVMKVKTEEDSEEQKEVNPALDAISSDHDYATRRRPKRSAAYQAARNSVNGGRLVDATNSCLDFSKIKWPRDALYAPYEPKFEYVEDGQIIGQDVFICDCCDPAMQKKDDENDDSDGEELSNVSGCNSGDEGANNDSDSRNDSDSKSSSSKTSSQKNIPRSTLKVEIKEEIKTEIKEEKPDVDGTESPKSITPTLTSHPGWFGKGRPKKRSRLS